MDLLQISEITSSTQGFEVFEESANSKNGWKSLKIRGVFQRADAKNQNGRIYPLAVLNKALQECSESLTARNMFGELDHPSETNALVSLKNVSHVVTSLKFHNNEMIGEAIVFDDPGPAGTPAGRLLGALIRNGCTVGISSRGIGSLGTNYMGESVVDEYKLVTFDCVHNPSTHQAYIHAVNENKDFEKQIREEAARAERIKLLRTEFKTLLSK